MQTMPEPSRVEDTLEAWRQVEVPLLGQHLVVFIVVALVLYVVVRALRRVADHNIEEVNRRHRIKKWIGYLYAIFLVLFGIALFAEVLFALGAFVAILLAALAVALQDVLKSVVGWFYLNAKSGIEIGSRVEVDGVKGDVIDIALLKTTLLEVGNLVYGQQSTGRLATVPNHRMLNAATFVSAADNLYVWQEVQMVVTFESDWKAAESILRAEAEAIHEEIAPGLETVYRRMESRYAYKHGLDTPIVYVAVADHGVELTVRYLTHVRRRRGTIDRISRHFLEFVEAEPTVDLAYPTWRIYRAGEPGARIAGGEPLEG